MTCFLILCALYEISLGEQVILNCIALLIWIWVFMKITTIIYDLLKDIHLDKYKKKEKEDNDE